MSTTYTWEIVGLKKAATVNGFENAIMEVTWKKVGTDTETGIRGEFETTTKLNPSQIDPNNYVPFNQLTEAQVLGWIQEIVTGGYEITVNERIQQQINSQKHSVEEVSLPWKT